MNRIPIKIKTRKLVLIALLPLSSFVIGLIDARATPATADSLLTFHALLILALILGWCWLDASERQYRSSWSLRICLVAFTCFSLPYYLFRTRGLVGGLKAGGLSLLVFIVTMVFYRASTWLA